MRATPEQISNLCRQKDYVAVFMPAKGEPYALSKNGIAKLDNSYYYDVEAAANGIELLVRQGKRKEVKEIT